jgi:hypothetical protein
MWASRCLTAQLMRELLHQFRLAPRRCHADHAVGIPANKMAPTWLPGPSIMTCPRRCPRAKHRTTNDGNALRTNAAKVSARRLYAFSLPSKGDKVPAGPDGVQLRRLVRVLISAASHVLETGPQDALPEPLFLFGPSSLGTDRAQRSREAEKFRKPSVSSFPPGLYCVTTCALRLRAPPRSLHRYPGFCRQVKNTWPKGILPYETQATFVPYRFRSNPGCPTRR